MESLQFAFRHLLITDEQVSDSVGDQIRPDKLAENDSLLLKPGILLTVPKLEEMPDLTGRSGPEFEATVEVACCAHTRRDAQHVEQLAKTALDGYRGTAGGLFFEALVYQRTKEEFEPPDDDSDSHDWYINVALFYVFGRR